MMLASVVLAATLAGLPDHGIWPDLDARVQIAPAPWLAAEGAAALQVDPVHKVLTVFRGEAAQMAYALPGLDAAARAAQQRTLQDVLKVARPEDRQAIAGLCPADVPVRVAVPPVQADQDQDGVVDSLDILLGAKRLCLNQAAYTEHYINLKYPGGDVPRTEGVCTDTLVRAMRNAGWDLQREVHEGLLRTPQLYPLERGKHPDSSIDHRRIRMVLPWFRRRFELVPASAPMRPGDIVFLDTFPSKAGPDHLGILSDRLGPSGKPMVINNWTNGYVEQEMDLLPVVPVLLRFRAHAGPSGPQPQ